MRYIWSADGLATRNEGLKTLLSAVVIVVGTWLAGDVGQAGLEGNVFEATGAGVPGAQYIRQASASAGSPVADWATERITATGQGVDPEIQTPQGRLKAARAAELDAKRKLLEQVHGLRIDSTTLVRDFVTQYDEIGAQLTSVLVGSVVESTTWDGDVATVTVSLGGMEVWSVIHQQLSVLKRR